MMYIRFEHSFEHSKPNSSFHWHGVIYLTRINLILNKDLICYNSMHRIYMFLKMA